MEYTLRVDTGKRETYTDKEGQEKERKVYLNIGTLEIDKNYAYGERFEYNKKIYSVGGVFKKSNNTYLDLTEVDKHYQDSVERIPRHDRFKHEIFETKDGEETRDKNGNVVRKWDKEGNLVFGKPYHE